MKLHWSRFLSFPNHNMLTFNTDLWHLENIWISTPVRMTAFFAFFCYSFCVSWRIWNVFNFHALSKSEANLQCCDSHKNTWCFYDPKCACNTSPLNLIPQLRNIFTGSRFPGRSQRLGFPVNPGKWLWEWRRQCLNLWPSGCRNLPSGDVKIVMENDHRNNGFSDKKMVIFHGYVKLPEGIYDEPSNQRPWLRNRFIGGTYHRKMPM